MIKGQWHSGPVYLVTLIQPGWPGLWLCMSSPGPYPQRCIPVLLSISGVEGRGPHLGIRTWLAQPLNHAVKTPHVVGVSSFLSELCVFSSTLQSVSVSSNRKGPSVYHARSFAPLPPGPAADGRSASLYGFVGTLPPSLTSRGPWCRGTCGPRPERPPDRWEGTQSRRQQCPRCGSQFLPEMRSFLNCAEMHSA